MTLSDKVPQKSTGKNLNSITKRRSATKKRSEKNILKKTPSNIKDKSFKINEKNLLSAKLKSAKTSVKKVIDESTNSFKESQKENKELNQTLEGAIARFDVTYISGLSNYPNAKLGSFIGMNIMPEKISFRKTSTSKKWFNDFDIFYESILEINIEKRTVSTIEMVLDFKDGINHEQETVICIVYQKDTGEELTLRVEMFTGITIYRQAAKCREFMALLRQHGILKKIKQKKEINDSNDNILGQIKEIALLKDDGILTEEEFQSKKKALLEKI